MQLQQINQFLNHLSTIESIGKRVLNVAADRQRASGMTAQDLQTLRDTLKGTGTQQTPFLDKLINNFAKYDSDGNQSLSVKEFRSAMKTERTT
jgi:hypothetical protein